MPLPDEQTQILEKRRGGGCASLFGLPFFLAGLAVMISTIFRILPEMPLYFGLPFGGIFATVGGILLFGRAGTIIDKNKGTATIWWGILNRQIRSSTYSLKDFTVVSLTKEVRRSDKSSYTVYPIRLTGPHRKINYMESRSIKTGRTEAEALAKFVELPLDDASSGTHVTRNFDELDLSIRERYQQGKIDNAIPEPPVQLKSHIEFDGLSLDVRVPPMGFRPVLLIPIVFILIFEAVVFAVFLIPMISDLGKEAVALPLIIIIGILFAVLPIAFVGAIVLRAIFAEERIIARSDGLSIQQGLLLKKTKFFPAEELEELELSKNAFQKKDLSQYVGSVTPIIARSDKQYASFANHLPEDEKLYIVALARGVLISK